MDRAVEMSGKIDKQLALEIWLRLHGPIDDKWKQAFLQDENLIFICENFTVEQITEAFGHWKKLEDARLLLEIKNRSELRLSKGYKHMPYSLPIWARRSGEK